ncbi:plasmalemma vesicle associated protein a [Mastacembelus armatus]|uniref:plasmalemma vesicle associated protein a n=1 Tax=Mastacembelus armatus TaxID=205130 RepID=UPI000E4551C8|nr:keratin, type II cytoskeletal 2 epidermal-like [Mastacembelus armatus]XP_026169948.1 keratin, type II cytoskeletal 2 epidermal-like [Mastacembelus armatus]
MYSSGYSQVKKYSPEAQKRMQYRSKGKSCGYYMRIVFFFSSLIQSLIIISLVLFLVYGKKQDSASTGRIQSLEDSFSRLSIENVALKQQRKNLTNLLNTTLTNKARNDWDLLKLRHFSNISLLIMQDFEKKLQQCNTNLYLCKATQSGNCPPIQDCRITNCGLLAEQLNAKFQLVNSNFTQTVQSMRMEMDQIAKERDNTNLEAIRLRRDKSTLERELDFYRKKSKNEFSQSLSGVANVSKAFLQKIESLFPAHIAFQLTCSKQREHLEQIRTNCTSLSREVEDRLQRYLNIVGDQVSDIQAENNRLKAENWRLSDDYRLCSQNRSGLIQEHKQNLEKLQSKYDQDKEKLLLVKMKLAGDKEVLENSVKYKTKEVEHLTDQIKQLNMSCNSKMGLGGTSRSSGSSQTGWNLFGGGGSSSASSSSSGVGQLGRTGSTGLGSSLGSSGSTFNKPGSTGTGSSSSSFLSPGSNPSLTSSIGSAFNKPGSAGTGSSSSSSSFLSPGSNPSLTSSIGSAFNKPGSVGTGSSSSSSSFLSPGSSPSLSSSGGALSGFGSAGSGGIGSNKPALNTRGSSTTGLSSGSTGSSPNLSSSGTGLNKPVSSVKTSSGFGSSSGSTGSASKSSSTSSGFSWLGFGSSNSGQSKTGSGTGKDTSSGTSQGGTGSSFGTGRTNGLGGGSISVAQHIQELQRLINPSAPEEKQDLSRMLG